MISPLRLALLAPLTAGALLALEPAVSPLIATEIAPGIVSHGHTFAASVNARGDTLYTVERLFAEGSTVPTLVIQLSTRDAHGRWTKLRTAPFSGRWRDIDPFIAPDGKRLGFNSVRPGGGRDSARTDWDIWYLDRTAAGWSAPVRVGDEVNDAGNQTFATVSRDGTIYYTLSLGVPGQSLIMRARPSGRGFATPETLSVVNAAPRNAGNPLIAPDGSWLIYVAERDGGLGDSDLWIVHREGDGWSAPRNLGPSVNTGLAEFAPALGAGGRTLTFTRMRRGPNRMAVEERIVEIGLAPLLEGR